MAHVSAAVGSKHGCGTDGRELADEEVIAKFSETAALELPAAAARDRGKAAPGLIPGPCQLLADVLSLQTLRLHSWVHFEHFMASLNCQDVFQHKSARFLQLPNDNNNC